jgi:hypothetical protein
MRLLKLLMHQPRTKEEIEGLIEDNRQVSLALEQFKSLGLCDTTLQAGTTYCVITEAGRVYYKKQTDLLDILPLPITLEEAVTIGAQLTRIEDFFDHGAPLKNREATNAQIKTLVGSLLKYIVLLRGSATPWARIAEYMDLYRIESYKWQDFKQLFEASYALVHNLLLDLRQLQEAMSTEGLQQALKTSVVSSSDGQTNLDDFLPDSTLNQLQQFCYDLGLPPYPETGILDLYFTLHTQERSLFEELKVKPEEESQSEDKREFL